MKIFRPIWAEIDCDNLVYNLNLIKSITGPDIDTICVVKADAYGHGAIQIARVLTAAGVKTLAVASLEEAIQLRDAGISADIVILGYTLPEWASKVVEGGFIQTVYHLNLACELDREARRLDKPCRVHIKIDTGMSRIGIMPEKAEYFIREIIAKPGLQLEGIFTHLSCADVMDSEFSEQQLDRFDKLLKKLEASGIKPRTIHAANSAGIMRYKRSLYNAVRPGITLYGLLPSPQMAELGYRFKPVMTIKTNIIEIKTLPAESRVSYGGTFITTGPTRVATLPAGYADGFSRRLSNRGHALIHGKRAPIIGNVCMDFLVVDVSAIPDAKIDDEVVLVGRQGATEIHFDEIASLMDTINYEVVSLIGKRVPRVYINYSLGNPAEL